MSRQASSSVRLGVPLQDINGVTMPVNPAITIGLSFGGGLLGVSGLGLAAATSSSSSSSPSSSSSQSSHLASTGSPGGLPRRVGSRNASSEALAGCVSGVVGTFIGYPLDALKNRVHVSPGVPVSRIAFQMMRTEGIVGTYRGIASPLFSMTILNALTFPAFGMWRKQVDQAMGNQTVGGWRPFVAGALVGPVTAFVSTPFEIIKIQSQITGAQIRTRTLLSAGSKAAAFAAVANTNLPFHHTAAGLCEKSHAHALKMKTKVPRSAYTTLVDVVEGAGPRALWTGLSVNMLRESAFFFTYFGVYENLKPLIVENVSETFATPIAGAISGASSWMGAVPLDVIKTRVQAQPLHVIAARPSPGIQPWSGGALAKARKMFKSGGIRALYVGTLPTVCRAFIVSATRFTAYEFAAEKLR
ncbi:carnitine/acylcarnitine transporter [Pycnococcus provasolii]